MSWTYGCPYCQSVVNPDETVILVAVQKQMKFLIGFHPAPGPGRAPLIQSSSGPSTP